MTKKDRTDLDKRSYLIGYIDGLKSKNKYKEKCQWKKYKTIDQDSEYFITECDYLTSTDNEFEICPYCGKNIEETNEEK